MLLLYARTRTVSATFEKKPIAILLTLTSARTLEPRNTRQFRDPQIITIRSLASRNTSVCIPPSPPTAVHQLHRTPATKMADDASYNTFLSRANQDPRSGHEAEGESTSQARSKFDPSSSTSTNEAIPASLREINATYTSDTDSDFEPVFLSYASSELPSVEQFKRVLGMKGENAARVEEISVKEFDPRGQYSDVVGKVEQAGKLETGGKSSVKVFRVEVDGRGTRVEYYVLAVGERSLVGVVAKAVES